MRTDDVLVSTELLFVESSGYRWLQDGVAKTDLDRQSNEKSEIMTLLGFKGGKSRIFSFFCILPA